MAILTFEPRHDLRKASLLCPSKIYPVHPDFITNKYAGESTFLLSTMHKQIYHYNVTNFNMSTCT